MMDWLQRLACVAVFAVVWWKLFSIADSLKRIADRIDETRDE